MLKLCQACRRHVRHTPCPFCGHTTVTAPHAGPANARALSRAQMVAAAALTSATVACGGGQTDAKTPEQPNTELQPTDPNAPEPNADPSATDDAGAPTMAPMYGAPVALYGAPPSD